MQFDLWLPKFGRKLLSSFSTPKMEKAGFSHNFVPVLQTKKRAFQNERVNGHSKSLSVRTFILQLSSFFFLFSFFTDFEI